MAARNKQDLVDGFADDAVAAKFARDFMQRFVAPAFGVLPKSEVDLLVFTLLTEAGLIDPDGAIYAIARVLNINPAKARSLVFQYQLRNVSEADTETAVLTTLTKARYWKAGDSLAFGVESPLVRAAIAARMRERGVFADVSLSGDILKVSPKQFSDVLADLVPAATAQELAKALRKAGVDESRVRKAIKELSGKVAEDFIKDQGKEGLGELLKWIGRVAVDHTPHTVDHVVGLLRHLI